MKVKMSVADVLNYLRTNLAAHRRGFKDACDGYRTKFVEKLNEAIETLKAGGSFETNLYMLYPSDHTEDYNYAIKMLEMTTQN